METPATQSGLMFGLSKGLVDSGLVGPERASTLQNQRDTFEREVSFGGSQAGLELNVHCIRTLVLMAILKPTSALLGLADVTQASRCRTPQSITQE